MVQAILLRLNADQPAAADAAEFGAVIARYEQEEMPERYSTRAAYKSLHQKSDQTAMGADASECHQVDGGRGLAQEFGSCPEDQEPRQRVLMHTIFQCAERWELTDKNPIKLVRVKGGTKRLKTPRVLAPEQFDCWCR